MKLAKKYGFMVISDFAYADIGFDGYQPPSFLAAPGAAEVGVEFTTMSKGYNMAGWRIGFCCGHPQMIEALGTIKGYYDYGIFQAIQIAAIIAMREGDKHIDAQNRRYASRRDVLVNGLRKMGWQADSPQASMFVWARILPKHLAAYGNSTEQLCLAMVDEAEVAMTPGAAFGDLGEGCVRLALVENEHRIRQALRQLTKVLNRPSLTVV